jgi:hypothetical protein
MTHWRSATTIACCELSHCACRTRALFAELQDTLTKQWGIPVSLETELEAQRHIQEPDAQEQHYMGLSALVAAFVAESSLPLQTARLLLDGELQDAGNDHQEGWDPARRTAAEDAAAAAEAAAKLSVAGASTNSSSSGKGRGGAAAGAAEGCTRAAQQQAVAGLAAGVQAVHIGSSSRGSGPRIQSGLHCWGLYAEGRPAAKKWMSWRSELCEPRQQLFDWLHALSLVCCVE